MHFWPKSGEEWRSGPCWSIGPQRFLFIPVFAVVMFLIAYYAF